MQRETNTKIVTSKQVLKIALVLKEFAKIAPIKNNRIIKKISIF